MHWLSSEVLRSVGTCRRYTCETCMEIWHHCEVSLRAHSGAECCSVLQCVAVWCREAKRVSAPVTHASLHCNTLQHAETHYNTLHHTATQSSTQKQLEARVISADTRLELLLCFEVCCSMLQCVIVRERSSRYARLEQTAA